ncbi:MAG: FAD-dependent oxidoreductase [Flavobacteriales bacterium]|nr:FAD-dependent oxidoreductase [Flavobacteriales bacterium]
MKRIFVPIIMVALAACGGSDTKEKTTTTKVDVDVLIVGAGASGMYAAYTLEAAGVDWKIFEAGATHGGRAQYAKLGDGYVEQGPEEVYSSLDYPIPHRTQALGWMQEEVEEDGSDWSTKEIKGDSVFVEGEFWDVLPGDEPTFTVDLFKAIWEFDSTLLKPFDIGVEYNNQFREDDRDYFSEYPYEKYLSGNEKQFFGFDKIVYMRDGKMVRASEDPSYKEAFHYLATAEEEYDGPDTSLTAVLNIVHGIEEGDIHWTIINDIYAVGTEATSLNRLSIHAMQASGEDWTAGGDYVMYLSMPYKKVLDTLYFNKIHPLGKIEYNNAVEKIDYTGDVIKVTDENGNVTTCNNVVFTGSPKVLQSEIVEWAPVLPARKVEAYNAIQLDPGWRLHLLFDEPLWEEIDAMEIIGLGYASRCWPNAQFRKEGATDKNVLMCYIMGENAEYLKQPDVDMMEVVLGELDAVFGDNKATKHFTGEFTMYDWSTNPYIGGVYTYPSKGMHVSGDEKGWRGKLGEPIEDRVFFAGEGTIDDHYGTVFGAMESGERVAKKIIAKNEK